MITTITLNAALDTTYYLPSFTLGQTNRLKDLHVEPGGKGINVAKVLDSLGEKVVAGGFVGGSNGKKIAHLLAHRNIPHEFVTIQGESRVCLTILNEELKEETEILEQGPMILDEEWLKICEFVKKAAMESKIITLSGSLPKGVPVNGYSQLIEIIQQNGAKAILDTSGEPLRHGLCSGPFAVKPNEQELKQLIKKEILTLTDAIDAGKNILKQGVQYVCISLGREGALLINKDEVFHVKAPEIEVVNTIGCGDAMLAGLASGFEKELPIEEILSLATAYGTANALQPFAGKVDVKDIDYLLKDIEVYKLNHI
ncbi:1-phosphofructokinase/tagatose 6-phosphate kinase [Bacillus pakistanensis]|uniref:Tagatose-6-phosphate kinase n=1 Tax=Rossellomorea pakistanensis TaxID=992288 RepID=A0ABS2NDN0_9BACI|nr:1-phosphofructokinase [Bacillus pakistanensis]MBM7585959.1 1-phosphofructokinase/tagatose 6-phosphate kinase [Bacillus pakistanensis]